MKAVIGGLLVALLAAGGACAAPLTVTVTDATGRPLANAAVSVHVKGLPERAAAGAGASLVQRNRTFVPGTLVVQTGTAVSFPNEDTVRHHVYSFSKIRPFEIKLYVGTPAAPVTFDRPGTAAIGCNIHDQMVGFVHVVDTPLFAVTDGAGVATIDVPPGEHRLRGWHADMGAESAPQESMVKVGAHGATAALRLAGG